MKTIRCNKELTVLIFEQGKTYEMIYEDEEELVIKDETGDTNYLSKNSEDEHYYRNWFEEIR